MIGALHSISVCVSPRVSVLVDLKSKLRALLGLAKLCIRELEAQSGAFFGTFLGRKGLNNKRRLAIKVLRTTCLHAASARVPHISSELGASVWLFLGRKGISRALSDLYSRKTPRMNRTNHLKYVEPLGIRASLRSIYWRECLRACWNNSESERRLP